MGFLAFLPRVLSADFADVSDERRMVGISVKLCVICG
jgi:hypothetical protein